MISTNAHRFHPSAQRFLLALFCLIGSLAVTSGCSLQVTPAAPTQPVTPAAPRATLAPTVQPTPTVTATLLPSPTPVRLGCITAGSVNIRSGPGTDFASAGKWTFGECNPILETSAAGDWIRFEKGWAFAEFVEIRTEPAPAP